MEASASRHEHIASCITRALFFSEAKRIKSLKAQLLRDTMGPFACAEYHMATVWGNFMSAADISQTEMLAAAKGVLDAADAADPHDNQVDATS
ncbi:hypothetical protein AaE_010040, partial [Aphanomyces astaci]